MGQSCLWAVRGGAGPRAGSSSHLRCYPPQAQLPAGHSNLARWPGAHLCTSGVQTALGKDTELACACGVPAVSRDSLVPRQCSRKQGMPPSLLSHSSHPLGVSAQRGPRPLTYPHQMPAARTAAEPTQSCSHRAANPAPAMLCVSSGWEELPKAASQGEMDGHVHPKCSPAKVEHRQVQEGASAEDGLGCGRPSLRASLRQLLGGLAQEDALNSTPPWNHWLAGMPVAGTSHDCCLPGSALAGPGLQSSVLTASVLL